MAQSERSGFDYQSFLNAIIDDGQDEVRRAYTRLDQKAKREGAIDGFEACRGLDPPELKKLLKERYAASLEAVDHPLKERYWYCRYYQLQVEWVANVLSAVFLNQRLPTIVTPTFRGAAKAHCILTGGENDTR